MNIFKYRISICSMLFFIVMLGGSVCSAKTIYSDNGIVSFDTPDSWYISTTAGDALTVNLLTVEGGPYSYIAFNQSTFETQVDSFKGMSYADKSKLRDNILRYQINTLKRYGKVTINKTSIRDKAIMMGFTINSSGRIYRSVVVYFIKDRVIYNLIGISSDSKVYEMVKVWDSLKINGIPFRIWLN